MGNTWKGISEAELQETERKVLSYSGLDYDNIFIENVVVDDFGNYARTIHIGDRSKIKLVMFHGYGASGIIFYKILKPLSEKFHVILVDILGMGASSRPEFTAKDAVEGDQFFVDFIENWRIAMGDLKDFYLAGHSFGGYICGHYASRYPQNIRKLLMLSAVGVPEKPNDFDITKKQFKKGQGPPKWVRGLAGTVWRQKWSPFGVMRKSGSLLGKRIIKGYLGKRMGMLPPEEFDAMLNYMHQIFMKEGSSEYAIFICFHLGMYAINPLEAEERLGNKNLNLPMSFWYGDRDWMDVEPGQKIVENSKYGSKLNFVYVVNDSDHHMYMDNPEEFARQIIYDIEYTEDRLHLLIPHDPQSETQLINNQEEESKQNFDSQTQA
ncbi:UNKNOWN [Stylonychia lemnae]|uniref:AB hydrolase-1 domain-containing protein n=1 Tax=Stylonychia lemnae TaxID=5949 RepID=A0A078AU64_STYLE|nr:UNKNOWN [Stylonychia lemnae]|eukprot:CDW84782.1 UNKNOWN [Stylonychia lemnae]